MTSRDDVSEIIGVRVIDLKIHTDERGWLAELFRSDEQPAELGPEMGYVSATKPGVSRGPHEHADQTDVFCFVGPGMFEIALWDNRKESLTFGNTQRFRAGVDHPLMVVIPPGVVHGYRNVGSVEAFVINLPNRLYGGIGRKLAVDEIRHEDDPNTRFKLEP